MQELSEKLNSMPLEERALMALYMEENPSADISDLIYNRSWNRNYHEWVEWKKKAYNDSTRLILMNDGDEIDLGYADVYFRNENRKSKGVKWSTKVKSALKRKS